MKFGIHYSLQSLEGDWAQLYENMLQQVVLAEKVGFDTIVVGEHHFLEDGWMPKPNIVCGSIASITKKVRIGTDCIILPIYHPVHIAEESAVLDVLSKGRYIVGIGVGSDLRDFEPFQVSMDERKSRMDEMTIAMQKLLEEKDVTFKGKHFSFNNVTVTPRPIQKPRPPFWIAALRDPAIKRAAKMGDAWVPGQIASMKEMKAKMEVYKSALKQAGKNFDELERPLRRECYIASDNDKAWEEGKKAWRYEYGEMYLKMGDLKDEDGRQVHPENIDEFLESFFKRFIIGDADHFIEQVEAYEREIGTTLILFRLQAPGFDNEATTKQIKLIGEKVIPYFAERERK